MRYTVRFNQPDATDPALVGGKGVNLGRLSQAGFAVPPGCVITTDAYHAVVSQAGISESIQTILASIDYTDADGLAAGTAQIRELITCAEVPADVAAAVREGYALVGEDTFVAVRSSGTAEDLAETSFAGQHDTYLDVRGSEAVLQAVKSCWASMWTARATAYRQQREIAHDAIGLAVVVQRMVDSDVSGVMFTANPMTLATDEIVINASYGLGEGIVSGLLTPDLFVVAHRGLRLKSSEVGAKEVQVRRNDSQGQGVVTVDVPDADRARLSLGDAQLRSVALLGRKVQEYYDGIPQDIEWALADGEIYLLQSRDITGAMFSWDEELEAPSALVPEQPDDTIWTRAWSDSVWPGPITPLFYSIRQEHLQGMHLDSQTLWGAKGTTDRRAFRYYRGRAYYNSAIDAANIAQFWPPALRNPAMMAMLPPALQAAAIDKVWSWTEILKVLTRIYVIDARHNPFTCWEPLYAEMAKGQEALGLSVERIAELSDDELKDYLDDRIRAMREWIDLLWTPFFLFMPMFMSALIKMITDWYRGSNPMVMNDLIAGLPHHTTTLVENIRLWELSELIRNNVELREFFEQYEGDAFFEGVADFEPGAEFTQRYAEFMADYGHRGHAERDMRFARRSEDATIDYRNLQSLLTVDSVAPDAKLAELVARREAAQSEVLDEIRKQPLGPLKAEVFQAVHEWLLKFFMLRDDERHHVDRFTMAKKRAVNEIGRRLIERGVLKDDEFWFLSKRELFRLLDGGPRTRLTDARIAGRRHNWERVDREFQTPMYLRGNVPADLDEAPNTATAADGVYSGMGTSRGEATGTARIIATQQDIGRVRKGDILITSSTDPGWTPVFLVVSGLILETGGLLAHGSCISREYGIPAVQLPGAMGLISDGATITVNGDTGTVTVISENAADVADARELVEA